MPDLPPPKRQPVVGYIAPRADAPPDGVSTPRYVGPALDAPYAELHCRTNFSFLEGASHPDELVQTAARLGCAALAITDRNTLAGVVRAHVAAKATGLKLLIGAEVTPLDAPPVVLLATDRAAYGRLARLLTRGRRSAPKGECRLSLADVAEHAEGLLACVALESGVVRPCGAHRRDEPGGSPADELARYRDIFADRCYALVALHLGPDDSRRLETLQLLSRQARVPLVASNDVYYHIPQRRFLQDVLSAIRQGCTVAELGERVFSNGERHLKSSAQMAELFADCPEAIARTIEIADRCRFSLDELRYDYPEELSPPGTTPFEHLTRLTWAGARARYPAGIPDKVRTLIEHELTLIENLRYEAYFLTVWDLVRFARSRDILCQGRGSAANSAVCYCLGVTSVDPGRIDVLFERFISKERNEAPDIDVDFEHERREEVIQYVYEKYGRERAGMTAEVISYRPRSAVRDVGKALGLSLDRVDALARSLEHFNEDEKLAARFREAGFNPASRTGKQLLALVRQILGFPRHLSQHVGGLVMTHGPLCELVPIENASMPGRTVIQWDKDDLDALGILKVDCLALGMLTAIRRCFSLVEQHAKRNLTLADVPAEDPAVYGMISRADTMGVFQIESRAQMAMLPRLRPRCFYDLVIEVAIVRPGPIQGDMVHPYLRRRAGAEPVEYPDERIRSVLEKTLGVPIFQEQAMRLAVVAAGFTPGEADQLRRAMGAWRRPGVIDQFQKKLMLGMQHNGYSAEFADRLFRQIRGFGEYGFPESHAASFALLVYISAWLKHYYPAAFTAAVINSQPMGFYAPAQLVADVRKHGVGVLPVDVNHSDWDCTLEQVVPTQADPDSNQTDSYQTGAIRLGFRLISGLTREQADQIVAARELLRNSDKSETRHFETFDDFARRTGLPQSGLVRLARADAFGSLRLRRRTALWQSLPAPERQLTLFADAPAHEPTVSLPPLAPLEEVVADYRTAGLSLRDHPLTFIRSQLQQLRVTRAGDLAKLPDGRRVRVAGLVLLRQRPGTASGITFVTLEDETGFTNLIIHPTIWERYHRVARRAQGMIAWGTLQHRDQVIHVLVQKLEDLSTRLSELKTKSRDFR
ncbi:MAG: error-prone DNA polymerase [Planctomycetaceae bacterium]|nr:error-prone DNA polymerase [Planctomycetaceae bacterium]